MRYSDSQATNLLLEGTEHVVSASEDLEGQLLSCLGTVTDAWSIDIAEHVYVPDETLKTRIAEYELWCHNQTREDAGRLMEEIAFLAFRCLEGWESVKSYQSSQGPQHDLVITGARFPWLLLMVYLRLPLKRRTIVIEAKNLSETRHSTGRIDNQQFSRLCFVLQNQFADTAELGVFFSRFGATGFPSSGNGRQSPRQRVLRDARATQIIFHAKTGKYVIVLDHHDIQQLTRSGALPRILEAKIRAVEESTGLPVDFDEEWREIDLPQHLLRYLQQDGEL